MQQQNQKLPEGLDAKENKIDEIKKMIERNKAMVHKEEILDDEPAGAEIENEKKEEPLADEKIDLKEKTEIKEQKDEEVKEAIEEKIENQSASQSSAKDEDEEEKRKIKSHADEVYQLNDPEKQIEKLVELAEMKGPMTAVKVARHLDDNYVMDKLHDEMVEDKVKKVLIEKGLMDEI